MRLIDAHDLNERLRCLERRYTLVAGYRDAMFDAMGEVVDSPTVCFTTMTTLNALRDAAYRDALERGLWRPDDTRLDGAQMIRAKAMELIYMTDEDRPMTYENALADVIIACLNVAGRFNVDVDAAVKRRMESDE